MTHLRNSLYGVVCSTLVYNHLPEIHQLLVQTARGNRKNLPAEKVKQTSQSFANDIDEEDNSDFSVVSACSDDEARQEWRGPAATSVFRIFELKRHRSKTSTFLNEIC